MIIKLRSIILLVLVLIGFSIYAQPTITYNAQRTLTVGNVMYPLTPVVTANSTYAYNQSADVVSSGFNHPYGVAVDAAGNIYVADAGNNAVKEIPVGNGAAITIGSGFISPLGVAVDAAGNVYVADAGNNAVKKIPAGNGTPVTMGSGFSAPTGIAVDALGNIYVADYGNNAIKEILAGSTSAVTLGSGFSTPTGVAVDGSGNVFVADYGNKLVKEIQAGTGTITSIKTNTQLPAGVAVDPAENIFVTDQTGNLVVETTTSGSFQGELGSSYSSPSGVAVAPNGVVYIGDNLNNALREIIPTGGYFLNSFLSPGLSFASYNGVISGTPAVVSAAKSYTVTAYEPGGTVSTTISLTVIAAPVLSYSNAEIFTLDKAITPLSPNGSGVNTAGYNPSPFQIASVVDPNGVATDPAGNVYVSALSYVYKFPPGGGSFTKIALTGPVGIAADNMGNVYVTTQSGNIEGLYMIPVGTTNPVLIVSGFNAPSSVAVDGSRNIYVCDASPTGASIIKFPPGGGTGTVLATPSGGVTGMAADVSGNLFVLSGGEILKYPSGGGSVQTIVLNQNVTQAIISGGPAVDVYGNLYVTDGLGDLVEYSTAGLTTILSAGEHKTQGQSQLLYWGNPAIDPAGNIYVISDTFLGTTGTSPIEQVKPNGSYYINRALPAGLTFNPQTGIISGMPTILSPATNYTVTAYNFGSGNISQIINIQVRGVAPATISYSSPQTYVLTSPIPPLAPVSSGVAAPGYSSSPVTVATGFVTPYGLAADASGNVLVADYGDHTIEKIPAYGGIRTAVGTGFNYPEGLAVDVAGNVYETDLTSSYISEVPANGGSIITLGSNFSSPSGVAVDAAGNVYVADFGHSAVKEILAGNETVVTLGSGFSSPSAVAVDAAGNVYVADEGNNAIKMIPAGNGTVITLGSGFLTPYGVAVDAQGNVFVADEGNNAIKMIPAGTQTAVSLASGLNKPQGVAVDYAGRIYFTDSGNNALKMISQVGGYYINSALPAGLSFNGTTGVISGTPAAVSAATNYTITGYNAGGGTSANLNINVIPLPPPIVSYANPQVYVSGTAITTLLPTSSYVAPLTYRNTAVAIGSGFNNPYGVTVDANENIFIADNGNNAVKKMSEFGGTISTIGTGLVAPLGITVDAGENVYVTNSGSNTLVKIPGDGSAQTPLLAERDFTFPSGIAVDGANILYIADQAKNMVEELTPFETDPTSIGFGFRLPIGVAVDASQNVYVADYNNNAVEEIFGGENTVPLGSGFSHPTGVAVDGLGNVFVADQGNNAVKEIPVAGGGTITIGAVFNQPFGVAVSSGTGNVYVTDSGNNAVKEITPLGGYFISPALPFGLTFNNATGAISGTPDGLSPATTYVVTTYNAAGPNYSTVNIEVRGIAPATISYSSPQNYTIGLPITPLTPSSSGVAAPAYSSTPVAWGSGFSNPTTVAVDASGVVYVADSFNNAIKEIPINGGTPFILASGFNRPVGVAVDAAGDVYVSDSGNNQVYENAFNTTTPVAIGSGFNSPEGVAVDAAGNVFVVDAGSRTVQKIPFGSNTPVAVVIGLQQPFGLALDAADNIYVADSGNTFALEFSPTGNIIREIGSGLNSPEGIAVDPTGNVFVSCGGDDTVQEISTGGTQSSIGSGFGGPTGLAIAPSGVVYVAEASSSIEKIIPTGGYYLGSVLPAGLTFNGASGVISGTPTAASPATNYTVTAYNAGGGTAAVANIKVTPNDLLGHLALSSGTLSPVFSSGTTTYTASVANTVTSITVTPTASSASATIKVNGIAATSGTASRAYTLNEGVNTISVAVTASDGITAQTYTVNVTRAVANIATLSGLTVSSGTLTPAFATGTTGYTNKVANTVSSIAFRATTTDPAATETINGTAVPEGTVSPYFPLNVGLNTITVIVTAQDGVTKDTYTIAVTRISNIATLSGLTVSSGTLTPAFATGTTGYSDKVANTVSSIAFRATTSDPAATETINGTAVPEGTVSPYFPLNVGVNTITIIVTAQDGVTKDTYTVAVTRISNIATLSGLTVSSGTLTPAFATATTSYSDKVASTVSSIAFRATTTDPAATETINGTAVPEGTISPYFPLNVGLNTITIIVTAQDGVTKDTYTIAVTRISNIATLSGLTTSSGTLTPAFATATTSYTDKVANTVTSIAFRATATSSAATETINGTTVPEGTISPYFPLNIGLNTITIVVTAQDGVTKDTYTIVVTRISNIATLSKLTVSNGTLTPAFATGTTSYTDNVANTVDSMAFRATTTDATATETINGKAVPEGTVSPYVPLKVGLNTITIIVTAQDGVTKDTYTIAVTVAAPVEAKAVYQPISVEAPTETPQLANDGVLVHQGVSPNGDGIDDFLQIDNITNYPDNRLAIMNRNGMLVYEAKGYDNATRVFDGHSNKNGQLQLPGTYFYELDYTVNGIIKHKTGFLVLKY
jgi:gliding motility-associated-like protein